MYEKRHYFNSEINGKKINDFKSLDYTLLTLEQRRKFVDNLLKNDGNFFSEYFDNYYKYNASMNDELSEKNTVCKTIESLANYLLGSEEIREERKNSDTTYKFYVDETEFKLRTKKELSMTNLTHKSENSEIETLDNVIHFLKQNKENFKKEKILTIKKSDFEKDSYCSEILNEYNKLYKFLTEEIKTPNKIIGKRQKLTKMKKDVMDDMIYTKEHLEGIFGKNPRNLLSDSTCPSWDELDYTNVEHMKKLLYVVSDFHPESEISFYLMDLQKLFEECVKLNKLSDKEIKVYKMLRRGYKNVEIAKQFQVDRYVITRIVNTLAKKLCKTAIELGWKE